MSFFIKGFIVIFALVFPLFVCADENEEAHVPNEALQTAIILNYINISLNKIVHYNDRVVLDDEYHNIINNINLSKINDDEIMVLLRLLMTTLTNFTLNEEDRIRLQNAHNKAVANSLRDSFSSVANSLVYSRNVKVHEMLFKTLVATGSIALNYERQIDSYRDVLDSELWMLKRDEIRDINELRMYFLDASWQLMRRYNIPDEWRITEEQINDFLEAVKITDYQRSYRMLSRMENQFYAYPPFWFYKGSILAQLGKYEDSLNSFNVYELRRIGFLRNDHIYSSALIHKTEMQEILDRPIYVNDLEEIVRQSPKDWHKVLYSALKLWSIEEHEKAMSFVQINIDNEEELSMHNRIMASISAMKNPDGYEDIVLQLIQNDIVKNNDILFLIGDKSTKKIVAEFSEQINLLDLNLKESRLSTNLYNRDEIELLLPFKWIYDGVDVNEIALLKSNEVFNPKSISTSNLDNLLSITFQSPSTFRSILNEKEDFAFNIVIPGVNEGVIMSWIIRIEQIEANARLRDDLADRASNLIERTGDFIPLLRSDENTDDKPSTRYAYVLVHELEWIKSDNHCFINDKGILSISESACVETI